MPFAWVGLRGSSRYTCLMVMKQTAPNDQKLPLSLSGNVHTTEEVELRELASLDAESFPDQVGDDIANGDILAVGDLKVFPRLDEQGRMAARGGHTNFGFSGYFAASIFDGAKWRRFDLRTVVPDKESRFAAQRYKHDALSCIRKRVRSASGSQCVWTVPEGRPQGRYVAAPAQPDCKP